MMEVVFSTGRKGPQIELHCDANTIVVRPVRDGDKEKYQAAWNKYISGVKDDNLDLPETFVEEAVDAQIEAMAGKVGPRQDDLEEPEIVLDLSVFSKASTKAMQTAGIDSIEALCQLTEDELLDRTTGIGPGKLEDIKEVLASHGLGLKIEA